MPRVPLLPFLSCFFPGKKYLFQIVKPRHFWRGCCFECTLSICSISVAFHPGPCLVFLGECPALHRLLVSAHNPIIPDGLDHEHHLAALLYGVYVYRPPGGVHHPHFFALHSSSNSHTFTVTASHVGCVKRYASIHFGMSVSFISCVCVQWFPIPGK